LHAGRASPQPLLGDEVVGSSHPPLGSQLDRCLARGGHGAPPLRLLGPLPSGTLYWTGATAGSSSPRRAVLLLGFRDLSSPFSSSLVAARTRQRRCADSLSARRAIRVDWHRGPPFRCCRAHPTWGGLLLSCPASRRLLPRGSGSTLEALHGGRGLGSGATLSVSCWTLASGPLTSSSWPPRRRRISTPPTSFGPGTRHGGALPLLPLLLLSSFSLSPPLLCPPPSFDGVSLPPRCPSRCSLAHQCLLMRAPGGAGRLNPPPPTPPHPTRCTLG
jgi:hypothetical protein